ncbi:hypothetical protein AX769_02980 [Frondihabitans sp. PAMC 28766]|uniref:hypothetical protein n=1 Tax=Frondihabitans sp. PAMC 28766 TaxID=1795630 RepID=UPI00078C87C8|nr:hypothetical protein [Frondihabitans sp. PAMC 28766]AMM19285.1 hypothetical protein AX769_02980 [Frondihabitans sp. PAMC 28766]
MTALDEIRLAEARRMLGLGSADDLGTQAAGWLERGVRSPSLELLAAAPDPTPDEALRLLRAAAVELDLTFATAQAARAHYVQQNLATLTTAQGVAGIADVSNGMTDAFEARLRRLFRRRR